MGVISSDHTGQQMIVPVDGQNPLSGKGKEVNILH